MKTACFIGKFELHINHSNYPIYSPNSRKPQELQQVGGNFTKAKRIKRAHPKSFKTSSDNNLYTFDIKQFNFYVN